MADSDSIKLCECGCGTTIRSRDKRGRPRRFANHHNGCGGATNPAYRHGHAVGGEQSLTYRVWASMLTRCTNPNSEKWRRYGGRGIAVCSRWQQFGNFLADMGEKPRGTSLDRIDNDGDYKPSNCRWATRTQQQNNIRSNRLVTAFGKTQTVAQLAREFGMNYSLLLSRLKHGWDAERAASTPNKHHLSKNLAIKDHT